METKNLVAPSGDDSHSRIWSPAALRSSSPRLSLSRPRRDSCSTMTTSSSSAWSENQHGPAASCVTRQTRRHECALHRFIVWAAVQRNTCPKMTARDKLECPLLRCRKRFPDHESMLKHLYTCDKLATGEYWCYDCEKPETFTDAKCKSCLGHPGKRRKIINLAKNFFSSLGHKARKDGLMTLDIDDDLTAAGVSTISPPPPPSYDSLPAHPAQFELSSCNEILEIDSQEVNTGLAPLCPPSSSPTPSQQQPLRNPTPHSLPYERQSYHQYLPAAMANANAPFLLQVPNSHLETESLAVQSWEPHTVSPLGGPNGADVPAEYFSQFRYPERPSLQIHTAGFGPSPTGFQKVKSRGKKLSPSSSLRSNASSNTTTSDLSPTSAFSGAWTVASGFNTELTSPTTDGGFLSRGGSNASRRSVFVCETISELPADFPVSQDPLPQTLLDNSTLGQQQCSFLPTVTPAVQQAPIPLSMESTDGASTATPSVPERSNRPLSVGPDALIASAWETIQMHVRSSVEKLQDLSGNDLAYQLRSLGPYSIARYGLDTLKAIINGQSPTSPLHVLCFVHVTYSLSLIIHEGDAQGRAKQLFVQAYLYSNLVPAELRRAYLEVATTVWQPLNLSQSELSHLLADYYSRSRKREGGGKGKERMVMPTSYQSEADEFLEIARFFLDELEFTSLPLTASESILVQTSALWTAHWQDGNIQPVAQMDPSFSIAFALAVSVINEQFPSASGLASRLKKIQRRVDTGDLGSVRRIELELIQAGKGCVASHEYFDRYVPAARQQCDVLYTQPLPGLVPRVTYHHYGAQLMKSLIAAAVPKAEQPIPQRQEEVNEKALDDMFMSIDTELGNGQLGDVLGYDDFAIPESMLGIPPTIDPSALQPVNSLSATNEVEFVNSLPEELLELQASNGTTVATASCQESETPCGSQDKTPGSDDSNEKVESDEACDICGFRPKGNSRWFRGSMAKHKKLQHGTATEFYKCPYPGCKSQYRNRPDNLRQHQLDKGHFVDDDQDRRPSKKRKKMDQLSN